MGLYDIDLVTIDGRTCSLGDYRGRTLLIVNVASRCGFTPQYEGLETLYRKYRERGFVVLGFPCNQFGAQEPGTNDEIAAFCSTNYGVTFPLFARIEVNGAGAHPLFRLLKSARRGVFGTERIKWNFTKFLIDANGRVVDRFGPRTTPAAIDSRIARTLPAEGPVGQVP